MIHKTQDGHLCLICKNLLSIPLNVVAHKNYYPFCLDDGIKDCGLWKFLKNEKKQKLINKRYKVICNLCFEELIPINISQDKACKIEMGNNNIEILKEEIQRINKRRRGCYCFLLC